MSFIITILAALLVFSAVIAIHEFGHFTVEKLCGICETLAASKPVIEGISQVKVKVNSLPAPTMHNEQYWIYTAGIEITFFIQK